MLELILAIVGSVGRYRATFESPYELVLNVALA